MVDAVNIGFTEQPAMRVDRQFPAQFDVALRDEIAGLAAAAKAELFQMQEHDRTEMVIKHRGLNVLGAQP